LDPYVSIACEFSFSLRVGNSSTYYLISVHGVFTDPSMPSSSSKVAAYGLSLDGSVTSSFLPLATSAFKKHAALGAIVSRTSRYCSELMITDLCLSFFQTTAEGFVLRSFCDGRVSLSRIHHRFFFYQNSIIAAVGKLFIARISDVTSRPTAYVISRSSLLLSSTSSSSQLTLFFLSQ